MEKKLNEIIISLSKQGMYDSKNSILDSLELLTEELEKIKKELNSQMYICIDEDRTDDIESFNKIKREIGLLQQNIEYFSAFRPDKNYPSAIEIAETEKTLSRKQEVKLTDNLTFTKPFKIRIQETIYDLPRNAWTDLLEVVCDIFAGKNKDKFLEFTKIQNNKKLQSIRFLESNVNNDKKIYLIQHANIYLQRLGDANAIGSVVLDLLKFFNCDNNYGLYVIDQKTEEKIEKESENSININSKVKHKKFGEGRVVNIDEKYVYIIFDSIVEQKQFPFSSINAELFEGV